MSGDSENLSAYHSDQPRARGLLLAVRLFALLAAALAAYLTAVSFSQRGLPVGCGSGSGCDEVLRSRWSYLFGIPMGGYALAAYLGVLGATVLAGSGQSEASRTTGRKLLITLAACIGLAVIWFVSLQLFVLKAICQWCMADHLAGLATAVTIIIYVRRTAPQVAEPTHQSAGWGRAVVSGVALAGVLFALQLFFGESGAQFARLPGDRNADTGPGPGRVLAVLNGELPVAVDDVPLLGSAEAEVPIVLLYDYCCPHCRATHGYLVERMSSYTVPYCLLLLPMPLDADCNESVEETEPRFEESCNLARIALAVWRADRSKFAEFDAWLYEPEMPRAADEARGHAAELVGEDKLQSALADPWIDERISQDVQAYVDSGAKQIPMVLSPQMDGIVGRAESADELFDVLEKELNLTGAQD